MAPPSELPPLRGLGVLVPAIRLPRDYARAEYFRKLAEDGVAGFLVFGGDRELTPPFLQSLRDATHRHLVLMTDAERGMGQQVNGCTVLPPLMAIGATLSEERAYEHGRVTALEARSVGIDMVLAPVADVLSLPTNPIIGNRSFGANPERVAALTAAWIAGAQDQGVLACAKHFPGHGHTDADSHEDLPVVLAARTLLEGRELLPFRAAVHAGVAAIMTAHVAYPALDDPFLPASLSRAILGDLLRDEIGFGGLILSDALVMAGLLAAGDGDPLQEPEAAVRCMEAGCDLLLHPSEPYETAAALEAAADEGRVDLEVAKSRLSIALADLSGEARPDADVEAAHLYDAYGLARDALAVISNEARLVPLRLQPGARVMALLLDDDDEPRRERALRRRSGDFPGGVARVSEFRGDAVDEAMLRMVDDADALLLIVACDQRAWKGRPGLRDSLVKLADDVLSRAGDRTICLLLASPGVLAGLAQPPGTLVSAWGDAPVSIDAALDVLLSGGPMRGLDPAPAPEAGDDEGPPQGERFP